MESATEKGYKMISIPAKDGGVAPVPSGGEFITIPTQKTKDSDKMKATAEVIQCLIDGDNLKKTNDEMVYLAAKSDVRKQQVEENSAWAPWVDAVEMLKAVPLTSVCNTKTFLHSFPKIYRLP